MPLPDAYRLLTFAVAPRPIAFVSSLSDTGTPNLAPFSFFMAGGGNPLSVAISPLTGRNGEPKDTLVNIEATREYVINIVTYGIRERMNQASAEYPYGVSEWSEAGFTPVPSVQVKPARVAESPVAMECRLYAVIPHGSGGLAANYVVGEVVQFHIAERLLRDGGPDSTGVDFIGRMGGDWYARANRAAMFELGRPNRPDA